MRALLGIRVSRLAAAVTGTLMLMLTALCAVVICGGTVAVAQVHRTSRSGAHRRYRHQLHARGLARVTSHTRARRLVGLARYERVRRARLAHRSRAHGTLRAARHARSARAQDSARAQTDQMVPAVASWYYDEGDTACGFHAHYGVASRTLPCGTQVQLRYGARTVTATVDDRGPYVYGRSFDLGLSTARALGMSGVVTLYSHIS